MNFEDYNQYKNKFNRFKEYLAKQKQTPEAGEYAVGYAIVDPHVPLI
jgi:uncharacterized protein YjaZ